MERDYERERSWGLDMDPHEYVDYMLAEPESSWIHCSSCLSSWNDVGRELPPGIRKDIDRFQYIITLLASMGYNFD